jgi:predicted nuclease of predicted toxin-antitoxin system
VQGLQRAGHDVSYVARDRAGLTDVAVLAQAAADDRILITEDKDFGELAIRFSEAAPGIILVRMEEASSQEKVARLTAVLQLASHRLRGNIVVVGADRIRFRRLPAPR